jgi:hypothetical protein
MGKIKMMQNLKIEKIECLKNFNKESVRVDCTWKSVSREEDDIKMYLRE